MSWLILVFAISLEVCGTLCMKLAQGFTRIVPSVLMVCFYMASLSLLTLALKRIPLNVAYAVWSGIGTLLIVAIGILFFGEHTSPLKIASIGLIILGVIGLRLGGGG